MGIKSDLDANFDFDIVDEFMDHYSLMVESMEIIILDLAKPNMHHRALDELFRIFHNIKSATGFLKITQMHKLAAFVEESLDELRSMDKIVNEETVNWLLEISDMFSKWLEDLRADNELTPIKFSLLKLPDMDT